MMPEEYKTQNYIPARTESASIHSSILHVEEEIEDDGERGSVHI